MSLGLRFLYGKPGAAPGRLGVWGLGDGAPKLQVLPRAHEVRKLLGPGRLAGIRRHKKLGVGLGKNMFSFGHLQRSLENSTEFMEVTQCRDVHTHAKVLFILLLPKEQLHKNMSF